MDGTASVRLRGCGRNQYRAQNAIFTYYFVQTEQNTIHTSMKTLYHFCCCRSVARAEQRAVAAAERECKQKKAQPAALAAKAKADHIGSKLWRLPDARYLKSWCLPAPKWYAVIVQG